MMAPERAERVVTGKDGAKIPLCHFVHNGGFMCLFLKRYCALVVLLLSFSALASAGDEPVSVAAASDLKFALSEVAARFQQETGKEVRISFGSSGNFARQIPQGAPFDLFLSADEGYIFRLATQGFLRDEGSLYAIGRIVLMVPHGVSIVADGELKGLATALREGKVMRFAIANPEHAPYGKRAEEALKSAGLWEAIKDKLVLGENVSQAAQFATSGSAQGGIFAYSLVLSPEVAKLGSYALIPDRMHQPLNQRMALTKRAGTAAEAFYAYLRAPAARAIFEKFGFTLPAK
jgi:molybdate transport system substrate-binding protein